MRLLSVAVVLGSVLLAGAPANAAKCTGRYLVAGPVVPGGPAGVDVIEVGPRRVSIASGCPGVRARVKGKRRFTKITAKWKNLCAGISGKAVLKARIDASCTVFAGRLTARKAGIFADVAATQSFCGDGVLDPVQGEQCDGAACAGGVGCGSDCTCGSGGGSAVNGMLLVPPNAFADVDTADPVTMGDNDTIGSAQALPYPATVGGASFAASLDGTDPDVYRIELDGTPLTISLAIADPTASDLDLFLVDVGGNDIVPPSLGIADFEQVSTTTETGTAFVVVRPFFPPAAEPVFPDPWTNYVLAVGRGPAPGAARVPPEAEFAPGELIVRFRAATPIVATGHLQLAAGAATHVAGDPLDGGGLFRLAPPAAVPNAAGEPDLREQTLAAVKAMRQRPDVLWAEPNYVYQPFLLPNDEFFNLQWHYPLISLPEAWDITTGSANVIVAVIDTGQLTNHPDFDPARYVPGFDFVSDADRARDGTGIDPDPFDNGDRTGGGSSSFHGTHVAGTIGAFSNNGSGVTGVDFAARIMPIRVLGVGGGTIFDIAQGIRFAAGLPNDAGTVPAARADVINMSLGGPGTSQTMREAVQAARAAGTAVVVAAGNENQDASGFSPASFPEVVTVSATDLRREKAPYSNFGTVVDIAAPGGDTSVDRNGDGFADGVLSPVGDDSSGNLQFLFKFYQGTSMASPHVAGIVALMQAAFGAANGGARFSPDQLDTWIASGAITDPLGPNDFAGAGLVNARKAVETAGGTVSPAPPGLVAVPPGVSFGTDLTSASVELRNSGTGALTITDVTKSAGADWLAVTPSAALPAAAPVTLALAVDRSGFAPGTQLNAVVTVTSSAGTVAVQVTAQVSAGGALGGDVGVSYALLVDPNTLDAVAQVVTNAASGYPIAFTGVAPGSYILAAGTDRDGDGIIGDPGEAFGVFPNVSEPVLLEVPPEGTVTVDLPVVEQVSLIAGAAGEGLRRRTGPEYRRLR